MALILPFLVACYILATLRAVHAAYPVWNMSFVRDGTTDYNFRVIDEPGHIRLHRRVQG